MVMDGYPQDLTGTTRLLNNYITEIGNNIKFRKISRKDQMGVSFTQTQEKNTKENKILSVRASLTVLNF